MGSQRGLPKEKILALENYANSDLYSDAERAALEYAEAITYSDRDVSEELFARLRKYYGEDELVELTAIISWENFSSKFNRALRVEAQNLWEKAEAGR